MLLYMDSYILIYILSKLPHVILIIILTPFILYLYRYQYSQYISMLYGYIHNHHAM